MFYYADTSFVHQFLFFSPRNVKFQEYKECSAHTVEMQSSQCCYCYYNIWCAMAHCVHMPNTLWKFMHFATIIIQIFHSFQTEFRTNFAVVFITWLLTITPPHIVHSIQPPYRKRVHFVWKILSTTIYFVVLLKKGMEKITENSCTYLAKLEGNVCSQLETKQIKIFNEIINA